MAEGATEESGQTMVKQTTMTEGATEESGQTMVKQTTMTEGATEDGDQTMVKQTTMAEGATEESGQTMVKQTTMTVGATEESGQTVVKQTTMAEGATEESGQTVVKQTTMTEGATEESGQTVVKQTTMAECATEDSGQTIVKQTTMAVGATEESGQTMVKQTTMAEGATEDSGQTMVKQTTMAEGAAEENGQTMVKQTTMAEGATEGNGQTMVKQTTMAEGATEGNGQTMVKQTTMAEGATEDGDQTMVKQTAMAKGATEGNGQTMVKQTTMAEGATEDGDQTMVKQTTMTEGATEESGQTMVKQTTMAEGATEDSGQTMVKQTTMAEGATEGSGQTMVKQTTMAVGVTAESGQTMVNQTTMAECVTEDGDQPRVLQTTMAEGMTEESDQTIISSEEDNSNDHFELPNSISAPQQGNVSLHERFGKLDVFREPKCLVYNDDAMKLQINEAVLEEISHINVPLSVVGVCGVYRSGKSYLMNKLFQERQGFALGSSIRSKTKGIWVWCKPHPTVPDQVLVLLDTEGLSDTMKRDQDHDTKIFSLTMLMSSVLIYNIKGILDQDALSKLSFITEVTKVISVSGGTGDDEGGKHTVQYISPKFVLCLRDFFYELVDEGEMTPDQYLEECLEESSDKPNDEFNNIRQSIKTFFPRRKCFVMSMPAMNKKLRQLETLPDDELDDDFKNDVQKMIAFLHDSGPKLTDEITKKCWTGNSFETFLRIYIQELSRGRKMDYVSAMQAASMNHNEKLQASICQKYQTALDELVLPEPARNTLSDKSMEIMFTLLGQFRQDAYPYQVAVYEEKCTEKMKGMRDVLLTKNSSLVQEVCYKYLYEKLEKMMKDNQKRYENVREYEKDTEELLQKYHKKFDNYDEEERTMAFQKVISDTKHQILEVKHRASLEEHKKKSEQMLQAERAAYERKMENMERKLDRKLCKQMEAHDKRMDQALEEVREAQEKERLEKQNRKLQKELTQSRNRSSDLSEENRGLQRQYDRLQRDVEKMKAKGCIIQ